MKKSITIFTASFILFAAFMAFSCKNPFFLERTNLHGVTFSVNGGTALESLRTSCVKECPYTYKEGYSFLGWYTSSDFGGTAVTFPFAVMEDTTLYARWQQMFTVSFEANGGDSLDSYKTGLIEEEPDVSRTNYIFGGWYATSDFSGTAVNFPYTVTKPTTLYAKWLATYQVTFATNDGSEIAGCRTHQIAECPTTTREGFTFTGWYSDSACTQKVSFPLELAADITLYAAWQEVFTVTFNAQGGSTVAPQTTGYIESEPASTKTDKTFAGWYLDADCTDGNKVSFPYTVPGDITFYAKWIAIQCTVTYYANGATGGTVPESVSVDKGSNYTVSGNIGSLEKTGYAFTKWNTRSDGGGQGYSVGSTITVTGDVSLYAQWGKDYAAMVTVNGGSFYFGDPNSSSVRPKITLSSFQIAQYELTYELWLEVYTWATSEENSLGYSLTKANKGYATNDQYKSFVPATNISWNMACVWLNAYSEYKGLEPVYYRGSTVWRVDTSTSGTFSWDKTKNGYRLPTECEWEFAAGGGSETTHDAYTYSGSNTIGDVAWYSSNSGSEAHPVGTKKANTLGIYDMSGNVAEWCYDSYASFGTGELTNPVHESGSSRSYRGGTIYGDIRYALDIFSVNSTSADSKTHSKGAFWVAYCGAGFRVARNAE